jgi:hypothetical protein
MARNENPPFARGETFYNGETIDANNLGGENLEGMEWVFEDVNPNTGRQRTESPVRCRVVRNVSGVALLPGLLGNFQDTAGVWGRRINGYAITTAAEGVPIDEYLPAAGVPNNDLFWVVIEGPAVIRTTTLATAACLIPVGDWVVASTAAASTFSTTAGRVEVQSLAGATAVLADQVLNRIGRAITGRTTAETNTNTLYYVGKW